MVALLDGVGEPANGAPVSRYRSDATRASSTHADVGIHWTWRSAEAYIRDWRSSSPSPPRKNDPTISHTPVSERDGAFDDVEGDNDGERTCSRTRSSRPSAPDATTATIDTNAHDSEYLIVN